MPKYFFHRSAWLLAFLPACFFAGAQKAKPQGFSQQLAITTDNDRYLFQGKDGYYTNGLSIAYSSVAEPAKPSVIKKINHLELGQKLYTPYSRKIYLPSQIDRPVTGYLYAKFSQSRFLQRNRFWDWGVSVGAIGKASQGEALQDLFHRMIGVNNDWWGWIWDYQLNSEVSMNLHGRWAAAILNRGAAGWVQLTPVSQATVGTGFTGLSQGLLLQLGKFNLHSESAYWNAALQKKGESGAGKPEVFFYYYPELSYQVYNATVQGGLFRKDKGPITSSVEPWVLIHQVGALFSVSRYTLKAAVNFQSKEAESQRFNHRYGSLTGAYRFR